MQWCSSRSLAWPCILLPDPRCICRLLLGARWNFQFKLVTTNQHLLTPTSTGSHCFDATETIIPPKGPQLTGAQGQQQMCLSVSCQSFIYPWEGPHVPCEAASSANQDHAELALKSSSCEILFLYSHRLKREHPPSNFLSAATLKMAHII